MCYFLRLFLFLVLIFCPLNAFTADQYETEPNDAIGSADLIVETGTDFLYGHLMAHYDTDWFAINAEEAGLITVGLTVPNYPDYANQYYYKRIYNTDGVMLGQKETSEDLIVFGPEAGLYYIEVDGRYPYEDAQYRLQIGFTNYSNQCPECGLYGEEDLEAAYDQGYADGMDAVSSGTMLSQDEVDQMISDILAWGDTDGDGKIGPEEAISALRIMTGQ